MSVTEASRFDLILLSWFGRNGGCFADVVFSLGSDGARFNLANVKIGRAWEER